MKQVLSVLLLFLNILLGACSNEEVHDSDLDQEIIDESDTTLQTTPPLDLAEHKGPIGSYVGLFEAENTDFEKNPSMSNLINVTITEFSHGHIKGHSIVAGNDRPFFGSYSEEGTNYLVKTTEPGDDKYDGRFEFSLDTASNLITGKWTCNDPSIAVPVRSFSLKKRDFKYVPQYLLNEEVVGLEFNGSEKDDQTYEAVTSDVLTVNPSTDELEPKDIENMYQGDLELIRNTVYARHGYSFRNRRMRYIFDHHVPWYMPVSTDIRHKLTDLEKRNIELIKRYEKHADKYYDEFSR